MLHGKQLQDAKNGCADSVTLNSGKMEDMQELIGKKITGLRPITPQEREKLGWDPSSHSATAVLEIEGDILIFPSADDEGNDAGTLFGQDPKGDFYVWTQVPIK